LRNWEEVENRKLSRGTEPFLYDSVTPIFKMETEP
jgi:hypothetical protein